MDLSTKYMGLKLRNPIVPSASPLSENVDNIKKMAEAGAGAVVMFSLFEEQVKAETEAINRGLEAGTESFAESLSYFPEPKDYRVGPEEYLELLSAASKAVDIPIIGSLNGISCEGWTEYAKKMQDAGAKALELNIYHMPTDTKVSGARVERMYLETVKAVTKSVTIPVAVKMSPYFSSIAHMSRRLKAAGAKGLVLFNRFYQPDFDLESMSVLPNLNLSTPAEIRLALRWIAILKGRVRASLAATSGVYGVQEVVKYLLAGADVVMTTSALLTKGIGHITTLVKDLEAWMAQKEYKSVEQMKGSMSQKTVADPTAFERANYIKVLEKYKGEYHLPA